MVSGGVEMLVGAVPDEVFGPVLVVGAGGTQVELLKDVAVRLTPVSASQGRAMLESLRTFPLLRGYRGQPAADVDALVDLLVRSAWLAEAHAEVAELELNPVMVLPSGCTVLDVRVRVEPGRHAMPRSARPHPGAAVAAAPQRD